MDEISRMEKILRGDPIEPVSRLEIFCAMAAGTWNGDPLTPVSRLEYFLSQISGGGGGGPTLSTFIFPNPNWYTGDSYYTDEGSQKITAPEGIAYDKIWASDEYITYRATRSKTFVRNGWVSEDLFKNWTLFETFILGPSGGGINASAFQGCTSLKNLVLYKSDSITTLASTNAFSSTAFASGGSGGTLYVPSALISSYQSASNWSTIIGYANNSIESLEGSEFQA